MINLKKQDPVADVVKDILQQEALKGNQHKIDKNKNNKIDAQDFKILRGEKPEVKEANNPFDVKNYKSQLPSKPGEKAGFDSKKTSTGTVFSRKPVKDDSMKKEEVEQVDEASYSAKSAAAGKDIGKPGKMFGKIAKKAGEKYGSKERGEKVAGAILKKLRMKEDVDLLDSEIDDLIELHEREMSPSETAEKERIVKGMKKSLKGFKQRYGERAKSVMYATATKQAMKEEAIEEGKRPESDTVPFVIDANTSSSPMKKIKEVARNAMKKVSSDLKTK